MFPSIGSLAALAAVALPLTSAAFDASSNKNIAVYWGQNSYGQASSQQRLSHYCLNTDVDIIPLAFMTSIANPSVNFANAGDNCTTFSGSTLLNCAQIETDIPTCQANGKTVLLSIGGATYTEGGFTSSTAAKSGAQTVWAMFGPEQSDSSVDRPFGSAVVDGFDFDFESTTSNMAPFGSELRSLMDAATAAGDKQYYLSAAPQCPYPDAADNDMLDGAVSFDFVFIQFYNNYCGVSSYVSGSSTQNNFNFATWDNWAQMVSANPNVKVLMGIPANTGAGAGYVEGSQLAAVIKYSETFSSFGGIMMWDMSQLYENDGFLDEVVSDLAAGTGSTTTTTTKTSTATSTTTTSTSTITSTTTKTSTTTSTTSKTSNTTTTATTLTTSVVPTTTTQTTTATASNTAVAQWGQCGGIGYTGSTTCQSPYTCTCTSEWWCHCK